MALKTGIVGLPNVGKSTLFNALMQESQAQAANFPFCTIEPNTGIVAVPDERLQKLTEINKSVKTVPTSLSFVDIAGLVAGASKGDGLGNQFLANIRECDAVVHVVRCFEDEDVHHVDGAVDPIRDIETIDTELIFADLDSIERRANRYKKVKDELKETHESFRVRRARLPRNPARSAGREPSPWRFRPVCCVAGDGIRQTRAAGALCVPPC